MHIRKGAIVRWAKQPPSVTVQRGNSNAEVCRGSGLVASREQGFAYGAGVGGAMRLERSYL